MNKKIEFSSTKMQVDKLLSQGLEIPDIEYANTALTIYGYSNIIKSYREPYTFFSNNSIRYRDGVTFDQVLSLYLLDKNLRNSVMAAMLDLEEYIKEAAATVISQSFGTNQADYLKYSNYQNKRKSKHRFTLTGLLETMNRTLQTDKEPIHHYYTEYGNVPPWILFKSVYLSTIVNFIDQFKKNERNKLVHLVYSDNINISEDSAWKLLMDTLFICIEYRNTAAHGGRIYNLKCKRQLRHSEIWTGTSSSESYGFSQLLFLLQFFKYKTPYNGLDYTLSDELSRHCSEYQEDVTYLAQILNMNIIPRTYVFVTKNSNKYHRNPYCSGINPSEQLTLDEALEMKYEPCKKCGRTK